MLINKGASFDLLDPANRATVSIILSFSIIASDFISRLILGNTFCYNNGFSEGYSECYAPGILFLLFKMLSLGGALAAIMYSITAMFLIDFGNFLFVEKKIEFNNLKMFISSTIVLLVLPFFGYFSLNANYFVNPFFLILAIFSSVYSICFFSKKIENLYIGSFLSMLGKNSLYIMAFHFFAFKIASVFLNLIGQNCRLYLITPCVSNFFILLYYLLFGLVIPIFINAIVNKLKKGVDYNEKNDKKYYYCQ